MTGTLARVDPRPIGMFDSGFGGLTVARAVIDLLPGENLVYVGDTGRYPYGSKPLAEVRDHAREITSWLVAEHDVKLVIVACNTASAAALGELQADVDVPVVGVIGTVGTVGSGAYQEAVAAVDATVELTCAACPGFVEFVERGDTTSDQVHVLAERLLAPLVDAKIDALLLGCTHYPFLARTISDVLGPDVVLVSSADETAFSVRAMLDASGSSRVAPLSGAPRGATHRWFSSGDVDWFRELGRRLLGPEIDTVEPVTWPASGGGDV